MKYKLLRLAVIFFMTNFYRPGAPLAPPPVGSATAGRWHFLVCVCVWGGCMWCGGVCGGGEVYVVGEVYMVKGAGGV